MMLAGTVTAIHATAGAPADRSPNLAPVGIGRWLTLS